MWNIIKYDTSETKTYCETKATERARTIRTY